MAVAQEIESDRGVRAASLLAVLLLAKALTLLGRSVPLSGWSPLAYVWQDLLVVVIFATLDRVVRLRGLGWAGYVAAVGYTAINVPLVRTLSSPLTRTMLRAARGTLADSIRHCLTFETLGCAAVVVAAGALLPWVLRRSQFRVGWRVVVASGMVSALGAFGAGRLETTGMHRNALLTLAGSAIPRVEPGFVNADWRRSPFDQRRGGDLSGFRGIAAGCNVVMIHLESTGAGYLRLYGAAEDPMPNLTALAENSILFQHAYAVYPESIKGLFSVLCSRYPAFDTEPELYARVRTPSIAAILSQAGYRTGLFHSGRFDYLGMTAVVRDRGYQVLEDAGEIGGNHESSFGVEEKATAQRMLAWIDSLPRGHPFLLTYLPIAGHHPYESPEAGPFPDRDDLGRYRNALHYEDAVLAAFIDGFKSRGLFEHTLFVILGDHGEGFGQHEGNYGHTLFTFEENVRVPLLVVAPGRVRGQTRVAPVASLIDVAPTLLDLLGLPTPGDYQGSSLLRSATRMALFYTDYSLGYLGLRDGSWKFVYELESKRSWLYDLARDPAEFQNVGDKFPERIAAYRGIVQRWSAAQRAYILAGTGPREVAQR